MFYIDTHSLETIKDSQEIISPEQNLLLSEKVTPQGGRVWELKVVSSQELESVKTISSAIFGEDLMALLRAAANGEGTQIETLRRDPLFKKVAREIPGIETREHRKRREKVERAGQRALTSAKIVGKGLEKIHGKGFSGRLVDPGYWMKEVVGRSQPRTGAELEILQRCWKEDKTADLSFVDWEVASTAAWRSSGTQEQFVQWLAQNTRRLQERKAWEAEHPGEICSDEKMAAWRTTQEDPVFGAPIWDLKQEWERSKGRHDNISFDEWKQKVLADCTQVCDRFKKEHSIDVTFREFDKNFVDWCWSGSLLNPEQYLLRKIWKSSGSADSFPVYMEKLKWQQEVKAGSKETFDEWHVRQEQALEQRYKGSGLPITYDQWKIQQNESLNTEPAPFVILDANQRQIYRTTLSPDGQLFRNGIPFNTEHEKTLHTGPGTAIFVIGPEEDLYCASHIGGIFHHSSFLGDGAVLAAGELKTDSNGTVVGLSNKSGHYKPMDEENLFLLQYFKSRGVDLKKVTFTEMRFRDKEVVHPDAQEYMDQLESLKAWLRMDPFGTP